MLCRAQYSRKEKGLVGWQIRGKDSAGELTVQDSDSAWLMLALTFPIGGIPWSQREEHFLLSRSLPGTPTPYGVQLTLVVH